MTTMYWFPSVSLEVVQGYSPIQFRVDGVQEKAVGIVFHDVCFRFLHSLRIVRVKVGRHLSCAARRSLAEVCHTLCAV